MTGSITYFADCSSHQGQPDWAKAAAICGGGAEKATEGLGYVNPDWAGSKAQIKALAVHGFVPVAYFFMDATGSGKAQAQAFAKVAGDLTGFGIVVDLERAQDGSPARQQAVDAVAELRVLYPHHPIGGYAPHWYTGGEDLTFFDWLWASEYVSGSGDPGVLYAKVPAAWWAPYGGRTPLMLQFTAGATIAGIAGPTDCSAFHGTPAQLAARVLPAPPAPPPPPPVKPPVAVPRPQQVFGSIIPVAPGDPAVSFPVWADAGAYKEAPAYSRCSLVLAGASGAVVKVTLHDGPHPSAFNVPLVTGQAHPVVPPRGWSSVGVVEIQRLDTKQGVGATATFRTW